MKWTDYWARKRMASDRALRLAQGKYDDVKERLNVVVSHFKNDLSVHKLQWQLPMLQGNIEGKDFEELCDLINIMREHEWAEKKPCRK